MMTARSMMQAPRAVLLPRALAAVMARTAATVRLIATTYRAVVTTMLFMPVATMKDASTRSATAIRFPEELHERLRVAADERHYSINFLVVKAVEDFLDRLIPVDELRLTRD